MAEEDYVAYLLRLWKTVRDGRPTWQASLENTRTGERVNLKLEDLIALLRDRCGPPESEQDSSRR